MTRLPAAPVYRALVEAALDVRRPPLALVRALNDALTNSGHPLRLRDHREPTLLDSEAA